MLLALGLLLAASTVVLSLARRPMRFDETAMAASRLMIASVESLAGHRRDLRIPVDPYTDPAGSGLIGADDSDLTTTIGELRAKQTSMNPAFAGLIVMWLKEAGVVAGDRVALSLTGSFPGLNIAALSACAAMSVEPVIISSVGASSFGANIPGFSWLDMERHLHERRLIPRLSQYASLGGIVNTEGGLDGEGYAIGESAIAMHGAEYLREGGVPTVKVDMERRWSLYTAGGKPKAYINVGGGVTALGWVEESATIGNGLLRRVPNIADERRGLLFRMHEAGVPVIHLLNIKSLAAANDIPVGPAKLELSAERTTEPLAHAAWLGGVLGGWLFVCALVLPRSQRGRSRGRE